MPTTFDQFQVEWLTTPPRVVADPLLAGDHPYQCVSFVKQGLREMQGVEAGWWGNAIEYWTKPNPSLLTKYSRLETQDVLKGDIVVLRTAGTAAGDFSGFGHIGFATGNLNPDQFELLEQNGATGDGLGQGGDVIRTRWIPKSRIAGVLRAVSSPAFSFDIKPFSGNYSVRGNKWNLDQPNFAAIRDNPLAGAPATPVTFTAQLKRSDLPQYTYYLEDANTHQGYNALDCTPYVAPPAAPVPVPLGRTQSLDFELRGYNDATSAGNLIPIDKKGYKQQVPAGTYPVYNVYTNNGVTKEWLVNLKDDSKGIWAWVNLQEQDIIREDQAAAAKAQADAQAKAEAAAKAAEQAAKEAEEAEAARQAAEKAAKEAEIAARWEAAPAPITIPEPVHEQVTVPVLTDTKAAVISSFVKWDKPRNYDFTADYEVEDILFTHDPVKMAEGQRIGFDGHFLKDDTVYYHPLEDKPLTDNAYGVPVAILDGDKDGAPWLERSNLYTEKVDTADKVAIIKNNHKKYKNTDFDTKEDWLLVEQTIKKIIKDYGKVFDNIVFQPFKRKGKK